jgi:putative copper resistance protein D
MVVFLSPLFGDALTNEPVQQLVRLMMLATGCLFVWPMLSEELLPTWCGYPLRMAFGFLDGLIDAVPGVIVMTAHGLIAGSYYRGLHRTWGPSLHWDQTIGGGLMLTLSEAIAVPFAVALFLRWAHSDEDEARRVDHRTGSGAASADEPLLQRPWWETDPGPLSDRMPARRSESGD